uniref:Uncharacterized protein LOC105135610 isoform X2 n=1 Tax=Rhizophora mucronata TaxID=61149 RepID=A0A2P2KCJ0_RHIMU
MSSNPYPLFRSIKAFWRFLLGFIPIGQQPQNPLLLLGQYSDDEVDEESNKIQNHTVTENSPADLNDQVTCWFCNYLSFPTTLSVSLKWKNHQLSYISHESMTSCLKISKFFPGYLFTP